MTLAQLLKTPKSELSSRGLLHTPHEIAQQPETWLETLARVRKLAPLLESALGTGPRGSAPASLLLLGAGTSDFVGRSAAPLLRTRLRRPVEVVATTDFVTHEQSLLVDGAPYLGVSFSRSGRSPESVLALEHLLEREPAAPQLIVTCDANGKMARSLSEHPRAITLLLDDAVNDRGLAMTSSYTNLVIAGLGLGHWRDLNAFEGVVVSMAAAWRRLLAAADAAAVNLARKQADRAFSRVCYLGSGALHGVALESALKLLELTAGRVSSSADTFLGLRHGPLSGFDGRGLIVALLSSDERVRRFELDVLREIKSKRLAAEIVAIAQHPAAELHQTASSVLELELELGDGQPLDDAYLGPVMVLFGQLLGLHSSIAQGLRPDTPSPDGVIHRVVSGLEMHA